MGYRYYLEKLLRNLHIIKLHLRKNMSYNWTQAIADCTAHCYVPPFNSYFDQNYNNMFTGWPVQGVLVTTSLVGLAASTVLCALNCTCCCKKPKDLQNRATRANRPQEANEDAPLLVSRPALPKTKPSLTFLAIKTLLVGGGLAATAVLTWRSLTWLQMHDQQSPLFYLEDLINACYQNCTTQ
jgi:hypothetical protein